MITCDDVLFDIARKYQVNISDLCCDDVLREVAVCDLKRISEKVLPKLEHCKAIKYLYSGGVSE